MTPRDTIAAGLRVPCPAPRAGVLRRVAIIASSPIRLLIVRLSRAAR